MGYLKLHKPKVVKAFFGILLLVFLTAVVVNFIARSTKQPKIPQKAEEILQQKVETKEKIEYAELKGQKENILIKADRQFIGEDGLYHLKGNVQIVFVKKSEGEDISLFGDEIIYDKEGNHFLLQGEAKVKFKGTIIKSKTLDYDAADETFRSDSGVTFSSDRFSGSSQEMDFSFKTRKVRLKKNAHFELRLEESPSQPVSVQAETIEYTTTGKIGEAKGNVRISRGKSTSSADLLKFHLFSSGDRIKNMVFIGHVKVLLIREERQPADQDQTGVRLYGDKREIEADELKVSGFLTTPLIQVINASGHCSFKFTSSSGEFTLIQADKVNFLLDKKGKLNEFQSSGNARIIEGGSGEEHRKIEGDLFQIKGKKNLLTLSGSEKSQSRILVEGCEISADEITVSLTNSNFNAKGKVNTVWESDENAVTPIGFFSREKLVFLTAEKMEYLSEGEVFSFMDNVKVWQGRLMLMAQSLSLVRSTGRISCNGSVKSILPLKPHKGEEEKRAEIDGDKMDYQPDEGLITYEGNTSLTVEHTQLQAQSLLVRLEKEHGEIKNIVGRGNVSIVQNQNEGKGEEAAYDLEERKIVLLGNPVLTRKDKGKTEGDKLTFYLADDKIVIENKGQERSITVIK